MTVKLVILDPMTPAGLEKFGALLPEGWEIGTSRSRDEADQIRAIEDATFAITADVPVTAKMLRCGAAKGLKAIHKWGVGYDNIDIEAARELGVRVLRTTGSNAVAVAETTLALILALQRNIVAGHVGLHEGKWLKSTLGATSMMLSEKTVGLVGLGYIGKQVARLLAGFRCRILYAKRTPMSAAEEAELGVTRVELPELLAQSDIVSLHCAMSPETAGMINSTSLAMMKKTALLVNTARGGLIVDDDLVQALESGALRGAALDVFMEEPLPAGHKFLSTRHLILTPHIGAISADAYVSTVTRMVNNLGCIVAGQEPAGLDTLV